MIDAGELRHVPLLQHLTAHRLEHVLVAAKLEHYEKGDVLFRQGERAEAIWIVLEGWVHLVRSSPEQPNGQGIVIFTITPSEALCGISAMDSANYKMNGIAGTACRALRVPRETFNDALAHEPGFAYHALRLCARRLEHIALQYGTMAEPVPRRIMRSILRLRQQFGDTLPVTHRELAQMSWTTTESAIRAVRRLKRKGYLTGVRGKLTIRQPSALERVLANATSSLSK